MIQNAWVYTSQIFDSQKFLEGTGNNFTVVSQRPFKSKKHPEDSGVTLTLLINEDHTDYGVDKKTGLQREDNRLNTFDATILNGKDHLDIKKGDVVSLGDYLPEKSYVIGFDLILRYGKVMRYNAQTKQTGNTSTNK
jgi:hypothetical protein